MTWRLITKFGRVINTITQANTIKGIDSYVYVMDRHDRTVYCIPEEHRASLLTFIKTLASKG